MTIEQKEKAVRDLFPKWIVSFAILLVGGGAVLVAFHGHQGYNLEKTAWSVVVVGAIFFFFASREAQKRLLHEVRQWHADEQATKEKLERWLEEAAADCIALSLALSLDDPECLPLNHGFWVENGLSFLAKKVQEAAEEQRAVQQNRQAPRIAEEVTKVRYDSAATKFYATRDGLANRGSEYAKSIRRWIDALK